MTHTPSQMLELPEDIEVGLFYAPAPMSEHWWGIIDDETKMEPIKRLRYTRDATVPSDKERAEALSALNELVTDHTTNDVQEINRLQNIIRNYITAPDQSETIKALVAALGKYEDAFEGLFAQCLSNGIFDAWGNRVDCTILNEAHRLADIALAEKGGK